MKLKNQFVHRVAFLSGEHKEKSISVSSLVSRDHLHSLVLGSISTITSPSSTFEDICEYTGPTQIIQYKSLCFKVSNFNPNCNINSPFLCNITKSHISRIKTSASLEVGIMPATFYISSFFLIHFIWISN